MKYDIFYVKYLLKARSFLIIFYTIRHFRQKSDIGYTQKL